MKETWKIISGFNDMYKVNGVGDVVSMRGGKERELTKQLDRYGYHYVTLFNDGKPTKKKIHRLVAYSFIPNPESKPTVNHLNEVKTDNRVENLSWATVEEQNRYSLGISIMIYMDGALRTYGSIDQACQETGLTTDNITTLHKNTNMAIEAFNNIISGNSTISPISGHKPLGDDSCIGLRAGRYNVRVTVGGDRVYVGSYSTKEEAVQERDRFISIHCPLQYNLGSKPSVVKTLADISISFMALKELVRDCDLQSVNLLIDSIEDSISKLH